MHRCLPLAQRTGRTASLTPGATFPFLVGSRPPFLRVPPDPTAADASQRVWRRIGIGGGHVCATKDVVMAAVGTLTTSFAAMTVGNASGRSVRRQRSTAAPRGLASFEGFRNAAEMPGRGAIRFERHTNVRKACAPC